jgi:hypothetical protein
MFCKAAVAINMGMFINAVEKDKATVSGLGR